MIRPDVVWFGEMLPEQEWNAGVVAARWSDVFFCVGTSGVVYPAASLPSVAKQAAAMTVEVNVEPTDLTRAMDVSIIGLSGDILPAIVREVEAAPPDGFDVN